MGYFDKTIESILNTPIEELEKELRECGLKFVKNPNHIATSNNLESYGNLCRNNISCQKYDFFMMPNAELCSLLRNCNASFSYDNMNGDYKYYDLIENDAA